MIRKTICLIQSFVVTKLLIPTVHDDRFSYVKYTHIITDMHMSSTWYCICRHMCICDYEISGHFNLTENNVTH